MAVSINARSTANTKANSTSGPHDHTNLTVAAGVNTVLGVLVFIEDQGGAASAITASWDATGTPQPMTAISGATWDGNSFHLRAFSLAAPTTGNKTLRISWSGGVCGVSTYGIAYDGAGGFANGQVTNNTSTTPSIGITSAVGNWTNALVGTTGGVTSAPTATTQDFNELAMFNGCNGGSDQTGAGTVTHSWTLAPSGIWAMIGFDVTVPSAGTVTWLPVVQTVQGKSWVAVDSGFNPSIK